MIAAATLSFCSTHATASCAIVRPAPSAIGRRRCTRSRTSSRHPVASTSSAPPFSSVAREPGRRRLTGQVLAGEHALRDRRPHDLRQPELLDAGGHHLGLDDPPQHRVLRLARHERDAAARAASAAPARICVGGPLRHADVEHLARPDDVGERLHRLLERRLVVVAVRLVEVDVVGLQPAQRAVDRLHDVLAGQAAVVPARAGRPVHLREDLQALAALALARARRAPTRPARRRTRRRCRRW